MKILFLQTFNTSIINRIAFIPHLTTTCPFHLIRSKKNPPPSWKWKRILENQRMPTAPPASISGESRVPMVEIGHGRAPGKRENQCYAPIPSGEKKMYTATTQIMTTTATIFLYFHGVRSTAFTSTCSHAFSSGCCFLFRLFRNAIISSSIGHRPATAYR